MPRSLPEELHQMLKLRQAAAIRSRSAPAHSGSSAHPGRESCRPGAARPGPPRDTPFLSKPTLLMVRVSAGFPSTIMYREHVLHHFSAPGDHRHRAYPAELVDCRQAAHQSVILHQHMPGQRRHRDNDPVSHHHIVADMAARQDVVMRANHRRLALARGAVNGDAFADGIVIADLGARQPAFPFQVLGPEADACEREDLVRLPKPRMSVDRHMGMQPAARPSSTCSPMTQ